MRLSLNKLTNASALRLINIIIQQRISINTHRYNGKQSNEGLSLLFFFLFPTERQPESEEVIEWRFLKQPFFASQKMERLGHASQDTSSERLNIDWFIEGSVDCWLIDWLMVGYIDTSIDLFSGWLVSNKSNNDSLTFMMEHTRWSIIRVSLKTSGHMGKQRNYRKKIVCKYSLGQNWVGQTEILS